MRYWMVLALSLICLSAYAEEKQYIALPKSPSKEATEASSNHVFMLLQGTDRSKDSAEISNKPTFKKVHCNLSSRYRSCF